MTKRLERQKCIWTKNELLYLSENAGILPLDTICKRLKRSKEAIRRKCSREGFSLVRDSTLLQYSEIARMLNVDNKIIQYWVQHYGLPVKWIALNYRKRPFVEFDDLVRWLKDNQNRWKSDGMEMYALGLEYDWLVEKRKKDVYRTDKNRNKRWTNVEIERLISLRNRGKSWSEIGEILGRPGNVAALSAAMCKHYKKQRNKK